MSDRPVIKHSPEDFQVRENMVVDLGVRNRASYRYFLLRKIGFTTFEAVRAVAANLRVPPGDVTYGGLKDEDGTTEQLIAVPVVMGAAAEQPEHTVLVDESVRWIELRHYGYGETPLRIGQLTGNSFRVVVRNLDAEPANGMAELRKLDTFFLNYYDPQRFGVPNGSKQNHLIGEAILAEEWAEALGRLSTANAPESKPATDWGASPRDFFAQLDPRVTSFYCSAYASARWNDSLRDLALRECPEENSSVDVEGINYVYVHSVSDAIAILSANRELPYTRYSVENGEPQPTNSSRVTVVQTRLAVIDIAPDEHFTGRRKVTVEFFLPSGCYATAAMRQILLLLGC